MNDIVRSLTSEIGFDEHNQLWHVKQQGSDIVQTIIGNPVGNICPLCGRGWEVRTESITDQYFHHGRKRWLHESCWLRYLAFEEYMLWHNALIDAGIRFKCIYEIKNEYGGAWNTPWYEVYALRDGKDDHEFDEPKLKFGRRKRVWNMELFAGTPDNTTQYKDGKYTPVPRTFADPDAFKEFEKEDVTKEIGKDHVLIHVWTKEKLREYLKVFARAIGVKEQK